MTSSLRGLTSSSWILNATLDISTSAPLGGITKSLPSQLRKRYSFMSKKFKCEVQATVHKILQRTHLSYLEEWHYCKAVSVLLPLRWDVLQSGFVEGLPASTHTRVSHNIKSQTWHGQIYLFYSSLYPVIYWKATKLWDVFSPFHQQEELLLHGLEHLSHTCCLLGGDVMAPRREKCWELKETKYNLNSQ